MGYYRILQRRPSMPHDRGGCEKPPERLDRLAEAVLKPHSSRAFYKIFAYCAMPLKVFIQRLECSGRVTCGSNIECCQKSIGHPAHRRNNHNGPYLPTREHDLSYPVESG
jgi:hypothetical protein